MHAERANRRDLRELLREELRSGGLVLTTVQELREAVLAEVRAAVELRLLSDQEIADSLGIDKNTWRLWYRAAPELQEAAGMYIADPAGKRRGAWRWRLGGVREWFNRNKRRSFT